MNPLLAMQQYNNHFYFIISFAVQSSITDRNGFGDT